MTGIYERIDALADDQVLEAVNLRLGLLLAHWLANRPEPISAAGTGLAA